MHVRLQWCCQGAGIWREEVNSVTQRRREFTKPEYLTFESAPLPGYCSLERTDHLQVFLCILGSIADINFLWDTSHVCSQLISLTFQSLFALIHQHLDSPVLLHLPWAGVQAAKITASFLHTFLFSCLVFTFYMKTTWRHRFLLSLLTPVVFSSKCIVLTGWKENRL